MFGLVGPGPKAFLSVNDFLYPAHPGHIYTFLEDRFTSSLAHEPAEVGYNMAIFFSLPGVTDVDGGCLCYCANSDPVLSDVYSNN